MKLLAALILCVLPVCAATAHAKSALPPPEVTRGVQKLIIDTWPEPDPDCPECNLPVPPETPDEATIRSWLKDGVLKAVNISPAKETDWLINTEALQYATYWCGTGGCLTQIWSPDADGRYVKVYDAQVRYYKLRSIPGKTYKWMEVDYHGTVCGGSGYQECPWAYEWREGTAKPALGYSLRFIKGETVRALPLPPEGIESTEVPPAPVAGVLASQRAACASRNAAFSEYAQGSRVPDLNGDGVDEWFYSGELAFCTYAETENGLSPTGEESCSFLDCGQHLWLSHKTEDGVAWQEVNWDGSKLHAVALSQGKAPRLVELSDPPGAPQSEWCDNYSLANCVQTPISLSPKP